MKEFQRNNLKLITLVFVRTNHVWLKQITKLGFLLTLGVSMSACASGGTANWKEEVLLHDGSKLIVERSQTYGGYSELASRERQLVEEVWEFTTPGTTKQRVIWKNDFGKTPESSSVMLLMLDFLNGTPYLATSPAGYIAYNKWGRPNPPYVFFKYDGKTWQRISLEEFPPAFINVNVVIGRPDLDHRTGTLSVATIREENRLLEPHLRTILRTPIDYGPPRPIYSGPKAPHPITPPTTSGGKE